MGTIIAFANQKGGAGKSTTAVHYLYWLLQNRRRKRIYLVDADAQSHSSKWLLKLGLEEKIPSFILKTADELLKELPILAEECDYLIVDSPGSLAEVTRSILLRTDLVVMPCPASGLDSEATVETIQMLEIARSIRAEGPNAGVFVNRAKKRSNLKQEAIEFWNQVPGIIPLKTVIHDKVPITDTFGQNKTVWHLGSAATDSVSEYEQLFKEVMHLLK